MTAVARPPRRGSRRLRAAAIAGLGLVAFVLVLGVSAAEVLSPVKTARWAPYNAAANAQTAAAIAKLGLDKGSADNVAQIARTALKRDPTEVDALFALGVTSEMAGDPDRAERLMRHAQMLSLREQDVQLWFIKKHLGDMDIPAAMREFDTALRSSTRNWSQIFPLLISMAAHPGVARELSQRLARQPEWGSQFLAQMAESTPDLPSAVAVSADHLDPAKPLDQATIATLIRRSAGEGHPELAWEVYHAASRSRSTRLRDGGFERVGLYPPIDWEFSEQPDLSAARQPAPTAKGSALYLSVHDRSGELARQLLHLQPGSYRLSATAGNVPEDALERPVVRISCVGSPARAGVLELRPASGDAKMAQRFVIPAGCAWQALTISMSGDGPREDTAIWIDDFAIDRL